MNKFRKMIQVFQKKKVHKFQEQMDYKYPSSQDIQAIQSSSYTKCFVNLFSIGLNKVCKVFPTKSCVSHKELCSTIWYQSEVSVGYLISLNSQYALLLQFCLIFLIRNDFLRLVMSEFLLCRGQSMTLQVLSQKSLFGITEVQPT